MTKEALAPIYLDETPIPMDGTAPTVSQIIAQSGLADGTVRVHRLRFLGDSEGRRLHGDETVDRTIHPSNPVLLKTVQTAATGRSRGDLVRP